MFGLPFDQIVHIQASRAFANLAAKEKRPRRHRGAGHRPSLLAGANATTQRAPLSTPMRPATNTTFSHIQIIPKISAEESIDEKRSPQPMFRKPSLTHDAEAIANSSEPSLAKPRDSIANNTQGTTFAAKARAAELQAARARKQLKENEKHSAAGTLSVPHEVMTFSKTRARKGKAWRTLDLNELPKDLDSDGQTDTSHIDPDPAATRQAFYSIGNNDPEKSGIDTSFIREHSEHFFGQPRDVKASFDLNSGVSPDLEELPQSVDSYDAGQWDPELPTNDEFLSKASSAQVSSHEHKQTPSSTPALYPVPVLTSASDQIQKEAQYLRRKQEAQLRELQEHLLSEQAAMDPRTHSGAGPNLDLQSQDRSVSHRMPESGLPDADDDPFGSSPSPILPTSFAQYRSMSNATKVAQLPYNLLGPAPRQFVPHQYPAVKGTMSNVPRFSQERTLTRNSSFPQRQDYLSVSSSEPSHPPTNMAQAPRTPYRKLSAEEKKGMLLQQLHAVVDESNSSGVLSGSGRTVLHDPFAYSLNQHSESKPMLALATSSERDLIMASDPLPWKDRPVDIISTPSLANIDNAAGTDKKLTPIGTQPTRERDSYHQLPTSAGDESILDAESWWSKDNRIDATGKTKIKDFMDHATDENRNGKIVESTNHFSGQPDEWSESSQFTTTQERLVARAVGDHLLLPVLANLKSYLTPGGYFNKHGHVPEWCIDQGADGQESFFGEDWGAPPPRVGRDPRYQPVLHEGTRSVYESFGGRWGSDGFARRFR